MRGTAGYMSPEQARREELDGRSDLYAVGIVLWELLARQRLRVGVPGDVGAAAGFQAIRRPSEYRQVPADVEAVAMRLLACDREERYRTAELAAHDLVSCQDVPRDGRGELARLLEERFPRARRRRPLSRPPELSPPSKGPRTVTGSGAPRVAPRWPRPREQEDGQGAGASERRWWRRRGPAIACGVLLALVLVLAATIALLVVR